MKRQGLALCLAFLFLMAIMPIATPSTIKAIDPFRQGPFLDKIVLDLITEESEAVEALLDDEIQIIGDVVNPEYLPELKQADNIQIAETLRNGYGYLTMNCRKYPFNLTSFRRAFAFAIDKEKICDEISDLMAYPQDSVVPRINPFSIEDDLSYHYYNADLSRANKLLDEAGFEDFDNDSIREAPNGKDFVVNIEVAASSDLAIQIGDIAVEAFQAIDIDAKNNITDFYTYLERLYAHEDYDVAFVGSSFTDFNVEWLAYEYWSEYADEPQRNFPNFQNATYDSLRDDLLNASEYEDVYQAAAEMQRIWVYQSPMVICYEDYQISAYRNDRFEGFVNKAGWGPFSFWTAFHCHSRNYVRDKPTGTLYWSIPLGPDMFSVFHSYYQSDKLLFSLLYESLLREGPDGKAVHWLAESHIVETHEDNSSVPSGHMRFKFELADNATWTDGTPLTAEDVSFSFNYYQREDGVPLGADLKDMTAAYAKGQYTVVIEFKTTSYWHLHTIGYKPIIPKHVFSELGPDGWKAYNPNPPDDEMVTSGPYNISAHSPGSYVEFSHNPNYFYQHIPQTMDNSTTSTTTATTTSSPTSNSTPLLTPLGSGIVIASMITIAVTGILWVRDIRRESTK